MFGYVTINKAELSPEAVTRYESYYCGLCRTLGRRHGQLGRFTLSYDMTFLYVLLSSLYEPEETGGAGKCPPHPVKAKPYIENEMAAYAADMGIALAYHKTLDDWKDDRKVMRLAESKALKGAYEKVRAQHPGICAVIEESMQNIAVLEAADPPSVDALANETGRMLGAIYALRQDDLWQQDLWTVGASLGRFIYLMDAYEDLPEDLRKKRFNPMGAYAKREDYETLCEESLSLLIAEGAEAFEALPLVKDIDILRNILYSGVWSRYAAIQQRKEKQKEKEEA